MNILSCPMCHSVAMLNSTGVAECYGRDWQHLSIECTNNLGQHCGMELSLHADFWNISNSEATLIEAWNALDRIK